MPTIDSTRSRTPANSLRAVIVLTVAAFFVVAVHQHLFSVNSHYYFTWKWQWIVSQTVYPILFPLAIPFFIGQAIYLRRPSRVGLALAAIMVSMFGLMIAGAVIQKDPPSFTRISDVVQSRWTTGFFAEARALLHEHIPIKQILARYPEMLPNFYVHPRQKPPGLILFEMGMIRLFGPGAAGAMVSGFFIAVVSIFSVLSTYLFIAFLTGNRDSAFFGASYLALCPSILLFFPQFDQCYPILTTGLILLWAAALRRNQLRYSVSLGFAGALTAFITHLPGVLIFFLIGFTWLEYRSNRNCGLPRIFRHFAVSFGVFVAINFLFWVLTGYDPIATLRACYAQVHVIWDILYNVYHLPRHSLPGTIPADLYDFALGSGWISYLLAVFYFARRDDESASHRPVALLCVGQFLIIAFTGFLQTEASRVWLFMLPLLMLPVGLELARWRPWARMAVYAALLLLTVLMCQSMEFVGPAM